MSARAKKKLVESPDDLLTDVQAAKVLELSARTLQRWRQEGNGPAFLRMSRGMVRYLRSDLAKFLKDSRRYSTSDGGRFRQSHSRRRRR